MTRLRLALTVLLLGAVVPMSAAQTPSALLDAGARAYRGLDFETAVGLLRRGLAEDEGELSAAARDRARSFLGAAEVFRANADSARAVFERLVRSNPRFEIDRLIFPPEVTDLFDAARRSVKAVSVVVPDSTRFAPGVPGFAATLYATSFHQVAAEVMAPDGRPVRALYAGAIDDSLTVSWDGLGSDGAATPSGFYDLRVTSQNPDGTLARVVRVELEVLLVRQDTLPHPPPPAAALLLPERRPARKGIEALGGAAVGIGIVGLSAAIAPGADLSASRLVVGAAVGIAGVVGFVLNRPGATLTENVAANEVVRAAWRAELDSVIASNAERRGGTRLTVRRGPVRVLEPDR